MIKIQITIHPFSHGNRQAAESRKGSEASNETGNLNDVLSNPKP